MSVVNGYAVNSAALASWVKGATVAATLAATVFACAATRWSAGQADLIVSATPTVAAVKTRLAGTSLTGAARGYLLPTTVFGGRTTLAGYCTGLAHTLRVVPATAVATARAMGYALVASELGEAEASPTASGEATPLRFRPGRATFVVQATGAISGVQFGSSPTPQGHTSSRAEASIQLSGEAFTRHDGYVDTVLGTATAQISATYLERLVALSSTLTFGGTATLTRPGSALFDCGGASLVFFGVVWWAEAVTGATVGASASGLRTKLALAAATASAFRWSLVSRQQHNAAATCATGIIASGSPVVRWAGLVTATATAAPAGNTWAVSHVGLVTALGAAEGTGGALQGHMAFAAATATAAPTARAVQVYPGAAAALGSGQFTKVNLAWSNPSLVFASLLANGVSAAYVQWAGTTTATAQVTGLAVGGRSYDAAAAADGTVTAENVAYATDHKASVALSGNAGLVSSIWATSHTSTVAGTANLLGTVAAFKDCGAAAEASVFGVGAASGGQNVPATALAVASAVASPILHAEQQWGGAEAFAQAVLAAAGQSRMDIDAPPSRSMIVPSELRGLIVPYENRTLRVPA